MSSAARPTLHLIGIFHTVPFDQIKFASCAFSGKNRRFPKMMAAFGYPVIDYSNGPDCLEGATEHVQMLSLEEFDHFYPAIDTKEFHGAHAVIGARGWPTFDKRLKDSLKARVKEGDFIIHPFGRAHSDIPDLFPQCLSVESGIGYPDPPFGAYRCFESEAWRHYHWGRDMENKAYDGDKGLNRYFTAIVPNYYDCEDWPLGRAEYDYVLFMGRISAIKGTAIIVAILAEMYRMGEMPFFVFCGQGDFENEIRLPFAKEIQLMTNCSHEESLRQADFRIQYKGVIAGLERAKIMGNARCMLMPTRYVEPFGGSGVEAMLCGTPLIASDYGCFTETVEHGVTGYRCRTLGDWIEAIKVSSGLRRDQIQSIARAKYSMPQVGLKLDIFLRQLSDLWRDGWRTTYSHSIPVPVALRELPASSPDTAS